MKENILYLGHNAPDTWTGIVYQDEQTTVKKFKSAPEAHRYARDNGLEVRRQDKENRPDTATRWIRILDQGTRARTPDQEPRGVSIASCNSTGYLQLIGGLAHYSKITMEPEDARALIKEIKRLFLCPPLNRAEKARIKKEIDNNVTFNIFGYVNPAKVRTFAKLRPTIQDWQILEYCNTLLD